MKKYLILLLLLITSTLSEAQNIVVYRKDSLKIFSTPSQHQKDSALIAGNTAAIAGKLSKGDSASTGPNQYVTATMFKPRKPLTNVSFTEMIPFKSDVTIINTVTQDRNYTLKIDTLNAVPGAVSKLSIIADGNHDVFLDGFLTADGGATFNKTSGVKNVYFFTYISKNEVYASCNTYTLIQTNPIIGLGSFKGYWDSLESQIVKDGSNNISSISDLSLTNNTLIQDTVAKAITLTNGLFRCSADNHYMYMKYPITVNDVNKGFTYILAANNITTSEYSWLSNYTNPYAKYITPRYSAGIGMNYDLTANGSISGKKLIIVTGDRTTNVVYIYINGVSYGPFTPSLNNASGIINMLFSYYPGNHNLKTDFYAFGIRDIYSTPSEVSVIQNYLNTKYSFY